MANLHILILSMCICAFGSSNNNIHNVNISMFYLLNSVFDIFFFSGISKIVVPLKINRFKIVVIEGANKNLDRLEIPVENSYKLQSFEMIFLFSLMFQWV